MKDIETNIIYNGDCFAVLKKFFPENCIDLIYLDPPFSFDPKYAKLWGDKDSLKIFKEITKGGVTNYINWMSHRLEECHRVLKSTGSIYLHCDWKFGHYLKVEMDNIFGRNNFRNHITWRREYAKGAKVISKQFPRDSDFILFYTKGKDWFYERQFREIALTEEEAKIKGYKYDENLKRWFRTAPRGDYTEDSVKRLEEEGRIYITKNNKKRVVYPAETKGEKIIHKEIIDDIWTDLPGIMHVSKSERENYPTQKPESLLERIIKASSKEGDIVLDPMCGCGTTIVVANKLNRRWIGIDISSQACNIIKKRMIDEFDVNEDIEIVKIPMTKEDLKKIKPYDFQDYICYMTGSEKRKHTSDKGIDGYYSKKEIMLQIKQQEKVGRSVVDKFETALRREGKNKGCIIAFSFTRGSYEEIARAKKDDNLSIDLVEVNKLIEYDYDLESLLKDIEK
ncbi:MAG: DNA methyltransferase [Candidatus Pacearchaeota archaeon]